MEHSHGDKVFDGVLVASSLPPLLRHDFAFLLGVFSRHYAKFAKEVDAMARGFLALFIGEIGFGKRKTKMKVAAANDDGER